MNVYDTVGHCVSLGSTILVYGLDNIGEWSKTQVLRCLESNHLYVESYKKTIVPLLSLDDSYIMTLSCDGDYDRCANFKLVSQVIDRKPINSPIPGRCY